ncbi:MAG: DUF6309 family protein [Candidatus Acidiferrales bacterium]
MKVLGPKSFPDLLVIFEEENRFKDGWYEAHIKDKWPRDRFNEANQQLKEWNEVLLSHDDLLDVKLHWNDDFGIPREGMTVSEALNLPLFLRWISEGKHKVLPDSHVWLATEPLRPGPEEHKLLKNYEGRLVTLDGIHRLLAWAASGKEVIRAYVAGKLPEGIVRGNVTPV